MNTALRTELEKYKKSKRTHPFPLSTEDFISEILRPIPNQPDIVIDATLLRFIFLFPNFISEFISTINHHMKSMMTTYGGVVFHIPMNNVTLANVHKYGLPLIQAYNRMLEQGLVEELSFATKSICCYFSSDVIRSILNLIKPLLNPHLVDIVRVFTKAESAEYFPMVLSKAHGIE